MYNYMYICLSIYLSIYLLSNSFFLGRIRAETKFLETSWKLCATQPSRQCNNNGMRKAD